MYNSINSKYTYKNSDVLKNKLGIKEEKVLKKVDTDIVLKKLNEIRELKFKKTYDEKHIKFIHKFLFEEIYDFSGEYRSENITKENFRFSEFEYISENMISILRKIDIDNLRNMEFNNMIEIISDVMTDLNVLHPFREGNGRAIREFIRELFEELGYEINFFDIDYDEILEVSKKAVVDDREQIKLLKKYVRKIDCK